MRPSASFSCPRDSLAFPRAAASFLSMALVEPLSRITQAEYLRLERQAEFRSEFFDGEMFAMAGGTRAHSLMATNLLAELRNRLKGTDGVAYRLD